jgi:hypothetical protein
MLPRSGQHIPSVQVQTVILRVQDESMIVVSDGRFIKLKRVRFTIGEKAVR